MAHCEGQCGRNAVSGERSEVSHSDSQWPHHEGPTQKHLERDPKGVRKSLEGVAQSDFRVQGSRFVGNGFGWGSVKTVSRSPTESLS